MRAATTALLFGGRAATASRSEKSLHVLVADRSFQFRLGYFRKQPEQLAAAAILYLGVARQVLTTSAINTTTATIQQHTVRAPPVGEFSSATLIKTDDL